jgi:hypothetical protein
MEKAAAYRRNFYAFLWHALFLAFAYAFIDVNTVLSSFVLNIGGSSIHVGILTGISIGLPMITQLLFAGFLAGRTLKKPFLLLGIYLRVLALAGMGYTLSISGSNCPGRLLIMIFLWIGTFAVSGAFAGISYTDIFGKVFIGPQRQKLLVFKEFISAVCMLVSAVAIRRLVIAFPYPENYMVIFFTASGLVFTGAFGFLMIKENSTDKTHFYSMIGIIKAMPGILRSDTNLISYILLVNLSSLGLTIIPFYVSFSKSLFGLNPSQIGNFVLLQFIGMILSTVFWNWVAIRFKFKGIACGMIIVGSLLPVMALFLSRYGISVYQWIFFNAGFVISADEISMDGILLEITNDDNRAVYTGISGALSLTTALFPLIAGSLIEHYGFTLMFTIISPLILISLFFLKRIRCQAS